MSNIIVRDPRWDEILSKIPVELICPRDYGRLSFTLSSLAEGKCWSDIALTGLSRPEYVWLRSKSPEFRVLAKEAEKVADEVRHLEREEAAHDRAVNGESVPTVDKNGNIVDWYKKRSDKLLELLLKASDAKYREPKSEGQGAGRVVLNVNFQIPSRVPQTVNIEEVVDDKGTKEIGSPGEIGPAAPGNP